jgi:hypothetical protein
VPCDVNKDWNCNVHDIDALSNAILEQNNDPHFDVNADGVLDSEDHRFYVDEFLRSIPGDANIDKSFDSQDLVQIFVAGQYEDRKPRNSTWATGDWNGDLEFNTTDLILAFQTGRYESDTALLIPEPSSFIWCVSLLFLGVGRTTRTNPFQ